MNGISRMDVRDYARAGKLLRIHLNEETLKTIPFNSDEDFAKEALRFFDEKGVDVTLSEKEGLYIGPDAFEFFKPDSLKYISEQEVLPGENVDEEYKAIGGRKKN
ncbi:MAG TPA: hypothetical protein PLZ43_10555 [bacterium]|nr:hypothetical protein [bacterium]